MIKLKVNDRVVSKHPNHDDAKNAKHEVLHWVQKIAYWSGQECCTSVNAEGEFVVHFGESEFRLKVD